VAQADARTVANTLFAQAVNAWASAVLSKGLLIKFLPFAATTKPGKHPDLAAVDDTSGSQSTATDSPVRPSGASANTAHRPQHHQQQQQHLQSFCVLKVTWETKVLASLQLYFHATSAVVRQQTMASLKDALRNVQMRIPAGAVPSIVGLTGSPGDVVYPFAIPSVVVSDMLLHPLTAIAGVIAGIGPAPTVQSSVATASAGPPGSLRRIAAVPLQQALGIGASPYGGQAERLAANTMQPNPSKVGSAFGGQGIAAVAPVDLPQCIRVRYAISFCVCIIC